MTLISSLALRALPPEGDKYLIPLWRQCCLVKDRVS
jgi:hypothetical protein